MVNTTNTGPNPGDTNTTAQTQTPIAEVYGTPGTGKVPQWNSTTGRFEWTDLSAAYVAHSQLGLFPVDKYGTVDTSGATDSSTAVLAAIAAAYAAGGGVVQFPAGTIRVDSQIAMPNDAASPIPKQPAITLTGAGSRWDGQWQAQGNPTAGTVLDLRSTTAPAKIDTRGLGVLRVERIVLTQAQGASDTNPFIQSTNTTLLLDDVAFFGHSSLSGSACVQDAIKLGGTTTTTDGSSTAAFQGYGTTIRRCYFARIRRAAHFRVYANSAFFLNNTISNTCGSDNAAAAIQLDGTTGFCKGNIVRDNLLELGGYVYAIRLTNATYNICEGNAFWDPSGGFLGAYLLEGTNSAAVSDNVLGGVFSGVAAAKWVVDSTAGANYVVRGGNNTVGMVIGGAQNYIQPQLATGSEATKILHVARSLAEGTNAGQDIFSVKQGGGSQIGGSWSSSANLVIANSAGQVTYDHTSVVKASGNLDLYPGSTATDVVRVRRGALRVMDYTTAGRPSAATTGVGTVYFDTTLNKPVFSDGTNWRDAAGTIV